MLIVEFHDAIAKRSCLLCKKVREEANYHQKVTAWATDKPSLLRRNLSDHILVLLYVTKVQESFSEDLPNIPMCIVLRLRSSG
jgi:hypothetical protein